MARLGSRLTSTGLRRLYDRQAKLARETDLCRALDEIRAAAVDLAGTDRGCVQLVSESGTRLEFVAQRRYAEDGPFMTRFRHEGAMAGCDAVRRQREPPLCYHGRFGMVDGASHWLHIEQPERIDSRIIAWLNDGR